MSSKDQQEAVEKLTELFLKFVYSDIDMKSELMGKKERLFEIKKILESCGGSLDGYWVSWLFHNLENKTIEKCVNPLSALAQTIEPDLLEEYGVPKQLIENTKLAQGHETKMITSKAGKGNKDTVKFNGMKRDYKEWEDGGRLLQRGDQERYIEKMIVKYGSDRSTVFRYLKEIKEQL